MKLVVHPVRAWTAAVLVAGLVAAACGLDDLTRRPTELRHLESDPAAIADTAPAGSVAARHHAVRVTTSGDPVEWTPHIVLGSAWLAIRADSTRTPAAFTLTMSPTGLALGTWRDTVTLAADAAGVRGATIPVTLVVGACTERGLSVPARLDDSVTTAECGARMRAGRTARRYRLEGAAQDSITAWVTATGFAPRVALWDAGGADTTLIVAGESCDEDTATACVRHAVLTRAGPVLVEVAARDAGEGGAFALSLTRPQPPAAPGQLRQRAADSVTAVPPGGTVTDGRVVFMALLGDPDPGDRVRLDVEHRRAGESFQGVPTGTDSWRLPGDTGRVTLTGLPAAGYRWQARTVDETGRATGWITFGAAGGATADFHVVEQATRLTFLTQPADATAGETLTPAIQVAAHTDAGVVDSTFRGAITVALRESDATLDGVRTRDAVQGVATFDNLSMTRAGAGYVIEARADGLATATSAPFTVAPGPAAALAFRTQPAAGAAGTALPPVEVEVRDAFGNRATGYAGSVQVSLRDGTPLRGTVTVSVEAGVAVFSDLVVERAGTDHVLRAVASGLSAVESVPFTVAPGPVARIHFSTQPSDTDAGQVITPPVRVTALDAFDNVATGFTGAIHISLGRDPNAGLSVLSGTRTVSAASGVASFGDLSIDLPGSGFTLIGSSAGLASVESAAFTNRL